MSKLDVFICCFYVCVVTIFLPDICLHVQPNRKLWKTASLKASKALLSYKWPPLLLCTHHFWARTCLKPPDMIGDVWWLPLWRLGSGGWVVYVLLSAINTVGCDLGLHLIQTKKRKRYRSWTLWGFIVLGFRGDGPESTGTRQSVWIGLPLIVWMDRPETQKLWTLWVQACMCAFVVGNKKNNLWCNTNAQQRREENIASNRTTVCTHLTLIRRRLRNVLRYKYKAHLLRYTK